MQQERQKMVQNIVVGNTLKLPKRQNGLAYLWLLLLISLLSLGLSKSLEVYSNIYQRQKEEDLIYTGLLYKSAIKQYYDSGQINHSYPNVITELLKDSRYIVVRRYLRKLYVDPITNQDFELIYAPEGGICGVRSTSNKIPIKKIFIHNELEINKVAETYQQWEFKYLC